MVKVQFVFWNRLCVFALWSSSKANMVGIVATMTNGRCKTCMGSGFVQYIDA